MTITKTDLRTRYAFSFENLKNSTKAEEAILARFSEEPDELHVWFEQIYMSSRERLLKPVKKRKDL